MSKVTAVLLDIGGVLTVDPWETLVCSEDGIAAQLGIDLGRAREVGASLWTKYSLIDATEADYWADFGRLVGSDIAPELVESLKDRVLTVNPRRQELLEAIVVVGAAYKKGAPDAT